MVDSAIVGSIGRKRICFALTGADGTIRSETVRSYGAATTQGVSAALIGFQRDLGLPALPRHSAFAVPGLVRGDAISITRTHWFLSRSGLEAMLGEPPLVLNDFAAEAWALCVAGGHVRESFAGTLAWPIVGPGCYLIVGITSGLGMAAVHRCPNGTVTVLSTEAGHAGFTGPTPELAGLAAEMFAGRHPVAIEEVISASGLLAIYTMLARRAGVAPRARTPEDVTRTATTDPIARSACEMLARAFWAQAGDMVLTVGAWDGLLVTGPVATAILPYLRQPETQALFGSSTKFARMLAQVPRALVSFENAELVGLAEALRHNRSATAPATAAIN
ncbi:glucokinase [Sphingomonas sp. 2R-10]|uniref:glucokinase n=1 Tax=Sphingomonas sp. 2R-10 TaxID=3045148 RepID=UPI0013DE0CF9|nr:glucokinase [Sphingomonas sp. 2R-10]MDJ0278472.1 glucokinase [Sphingomonas sp. 2R-10]